MVKRVARRAPVNIYARAPNKFIPRLQTALVRHSSRPDMRQGRMVIMLMIPECVESADFPCDRRTGF